MRRARVDWLLRASHEDKMCPGCGVARYCSVACQTVTGRRGTGPNVAGYSLCERGIMNGCTCTWISSRQRLYRMVNVISATCASGGVGVTEGTARWPVSYRYLLNELKCEKNVHTLSQSHQNKPKTMLTATLRTTIADTGAELFTTQPASKANNQQCTCADNRSYSNILVFHVNSLHSFRVLSFSVPPRYTFHTFTEMRVPPGSRCCVLAPPSRTCPPPASPLYPPPPPRPG